MKKQIKNFLNMINKRRNTLKYVLMFEFDFLESDLVGLTTKELSALVVALRAHQKMLRLTVTMLNENN